jgi:sulfate adenylyltransferase subunit 2
MIDPALLDLLGLDQPIVWDTETAFQHLHDLGKADTKRTAERRLHELKILPNEIKPERLIDEIGRPANPLLLDWVLNKARAQRKLVLFVQLSDLPTGQPCLHANDARGARYWLPLEPAETQSLDQSVITDGVLKGLSSLQAHVAKNIAVFPHGGLVGLLRQTDGLEQIALFPSVYQPILQLDGQRAGIRSKDRDNNEGKKDDNDQQTYVDHRNGDRTGNDGGSRDGPRNGCGPVESGSDYGGDNPSTADNPALALTPHLKRLEAESIHIIREAVAEAENPVLLYSIGKDSSALLHLIRKAFYPAPPPLPIMHVDTRWKFQEMYLFRDHVAKSSGMDLLLHTNPEAIARDINPFDHGTDIYINITKVEGLKQAIDHHKFDVLFGGARRDEEKSRAKERIFSFRSSTHRWDPKQQRPELWNLYNPKKNKGESIRVFALSNWTELDIWQYIYLENIPVVPLYFAKKRPVVERNGTLLMIDDERFRLMPGEEIQERVIRFRSLGCYPLTGAIESSATNVQEIIMELLNARKSERQGRVVDHDSPYSMEKKKQEGHF